MAATKRERLEKLVADIQKAADDVDSIRAKGEEPEAQVLESIVKMSKEARSLKNEILEDARRERDAKDAGESLEDVKSFLTSLGINPDAKSENPQNAKQGAKGLSIADAFLASDQYKSMLAKFPGGRIPERASLSMDPVGFKALITGAGATSGGALISPDRTGITDFGAFTRPLTIRDVITIGQTDSDTVEYARITGFTNNAAPVAEATESGVIDGTDITTVEGGLKPESALTFEKVTAPVKTIAHWVPATRRALSDAGQLRTIIDQFLRSGLEEELEDQIVSGDGTGENFDGIATTSGVQTHALGGDTPLDAYLKAKTKVRVVGRARATAYLMHPNDWQQLLLVKDSQGNYLLGGPGAEVQPRLWGLPVVESEGVPENTAYVGDFRKAVLWDREQASVTISTEHADFFTRNLIAILAEMRAAFGILQPSALVKITGI